LIFFNFNVYAEMDITDINYLLAVQKF